jgi:dimethylaniline monooxygenase (N-oxide forming)
MAPSDGTVCVIGAGASGLAALKALVEARIPAECFEKGSHVGGLWRYENDNGVAACYATLRINTWKGITAYSDFPMPPGYSDYADHRQMAAYFDAYADHFELRRRIAFRTEVLRVRPAPDGSWQVELSDGGARRYRAVVVANGHHWSPRRAELPGRFAGLQIHSFEYRTPELFAGRKVAILGMGNSGVDIACDAARTAERVYLSTRRGAHVLPRYLLGLPIDKLGTGIASLLPMPLQRAVLAGLLWIERGPLAKYGLPRPDHKLLESHPTISTDLPSLVQEGKVRMKPSVAELRDDRVCFADGTEELVDILVHATGYEVRFPFLDRSILDTQSAPPPLYLRVVPPERQGLYFIGLVQLVRGSIPRVAELQSRWVAGILSGRLSLPPADEMQARIARRQAEVERRYVRSLRHQLQEDFRPYLRALRVEMRRSAH